MVFIINNIYIYIYIIIDDVSTQETYNLKDPSVVFKSFYRYHTTLLSLIYTLYRAYSICILTLIYTIYRAYNICILTLIYTYTNII